MAGTPRKKQIQPAIPSKPGKASGKSTPRKKQIKQSVKPKKAY